MAKYQSMLVVIDPNQDDQPALRRAVYLHQRIGGRIKAFLPIYDFSYEMTTLLSPDERTAMRQGVIAQRTAWIREQAKFYLESGVPIDVKVVWHNRPFEAIIQEVVSEKHDLLLKMAHQHDKLEAVIFTRRTGICCVNALARCGWSKTSRGRKAAKRWSPSISPAKRIITTPLTRSWFARRCRWRKKSTTLKCT